MPHRLMSLKTALSNPSNDVLAALAVRQGLINALEGWSGRTDRCCTFIPYGTKLTSELRCFALSLLEQLDNYFPTATRPYPRYDLEGFWTIALADAG